MREIIPAIVGALALVPPDPEQPPVCVCVCLSVFTKEGEREKYVPYVQSGIPNCASDARSGYPLPLALNVFTEGNVLGATFCANSMYSFVTFF